MLRSVLHYLLSLAVVVAGYVTYAQTAARYIEPPATKKVAHVGPQRPTPPPKHNPYAHLFAAGDWELDNPKTLETPQGTLLFREYIPHEQGRLEIVPCTLIFYSSSPADGDLQHSGSPIIVQAPRGATLQFDEAIDLTLGRFGKLVGGRINGEIRIYSPESSPGAADGLEMKTRNVQIERLQAWTPHEVVFQYGRNRGRGRDLVIGLTASDKLSDGKSRGPTVSGVDSIQLTQVEEIELADGDGGLLSDSSMSSSSSNKSSDAPVKITCDGPLRFDTTKRVATFDENVVIAREGQGGVFDKLVCRQLAIFLVKEGATKSASPSAADASPLKGNVERIVATGEPVVLEAPSQRVHVEGDRLEYSLLTRRLHVKNQSPEANVLLRRGEEEFSAPEVAYESSPDRRLGKLWASGPGKLTGRLAGAGGESRLFTAQWKKEIRIRPHEANQVITLLDDARVQVENQGGFRADELHFWLLESPNGSNAASRIQPDRLLATGNVRADSPQLSADVKRLEAWFQHEPVELSPEAQSIGGPPAPLVLHPAAGAISEPNRPLVRIREPLSPAKESNAVAAEEPEAEPQHFHAVGELLRIQLLAKSRTTEVREVSLEGEKVSIKETNAPEDQTPFSLQGTRVDLEGGMGPQSNVTVSGRPGVVTARGMKLTASGMKLNRRENRLLVDREGEMELAMTGDLHGRPTKSEARPMRIVWKGSMVFDGGAARFREKVAIDGDGFAATCDQMEAVLNSRLDFNRPQKSDTKPDLQRLILTGKVQTTYRSYFEDGTQQSVDRLIARIVTVDRASGDLNAQGPGYLSTVRVGSSNVFGPGPAAAEPVPIGKEAPRGEEGLTYLRVDFRSQLIGNMNRKRAEFQEQVQAVYGPVEHWEAVIDPAARESLGDKGMLLTADRLAVAEIGTGRTNEKTAEMEATGNTRVDGRDFTARAERLSYSTAKNQLVLEGDGRNDAEIRHYLKNNFTSARRIVFLRDSNTIQVDDARVLNIGPIGNVNNAPRPPSPRDTPRR